MARSAKAIPWFLFAAGGTVVAFVMPVMVFLTSLGPAAGLFENALAYETMRAFVGGWLIKLILFGIITMMLWHAAHRLRVCTHDFGIRADEPAAIILYGFAGFGTLLTLFALLSI